MKQLSLFDTDKETIKITKPIRLIELFAGYGSQAMAMKRLEVNFETYRMIEFDKYAVNSYNAVHNTQYEPTDITEIHGPDLGIIDTEKYEYIMSYSFPCTDIFIGWKTKRNEQRFENTKQSFMGSRKNSY